MNEEKLKKCPFCAEEIKQEAIKCKHCGEFLNDLNKQKDKTKTTTLETVNQNNYKRNKNEYIILFIILVAPPIISKILYYYDGTVLFSQYTAEFLTVISKIGLIAITIRYSYKVKLNIILSLLLGFSTLLPLMGWISFIYLVSIKPHKKIELEEKTEEELKKEKEEKKNKNETEKKRFRKNIIMMFLSITILMLIAMLIGIFTENK